MTTEDRNLRRKKPWWIFKNLDLWTITQFSAFVTRDVLDATSSRPRQLWYGNWHTENEIPHKYSRNREIMMERFMLAVVLGTLVLSFKLADARQLTPLSQNDPPQRPVDDPGWQAAHPHHPRQIIVAFNDPSGAPGRPLYGNGNVRVVRVITAPTSFSRHHRVSDIVSVLCFVSLLTHWCDIAEL